MIPIENTLRGPMHLEKSRAAEIALEASRSEKQFRHLLGLIASDDVTLAKRAAWCFSLAAGQRPDWTANCQGELVGLLDSPQDGILRNTLRVLRGCGSGLLPELYDKTAYYCFEFVQDPKRAIAIRAFALHILGQISLAVPEIRPEIREIIDYYFMEGAAGLTSAGKTVLKALAKAEKS